MPRSKSKSQPQDPQPPPPISAPSTFTDSLPLPTIIVFDLDYTLWPFWVDTHVSAPVKPATPPPAHNTRMLDRWGESFGFYSDIPGILASGHERGITMSLASRTHAPDLARDMLRGLTVPSNSAATDSSKAKPLRAIDFFVHAQIYPGTKTTHFKRIQAATEKAGSEVPFEDMLFFDDEGRNRNVETELGVTFWLVPHGVTKDEVDNGVWEWRKRRGITRKDLPAKESHAAELEG